MIIVRLYGGLGNQLFQYAAGRRLANAHNTELRLDTSSLREGAWRRFELGAFNIDGKIASEGQIIIAKYGKRKLASRALGRLLNRPPEPASTFVRERHFHFDQDILTLPDGVYLDGYWQSERYFKDIEDIVRSEFEVKSPPRGKNKELTELIKACNSVSLHVRRGDYVNNPQTHEFHGICGVDYYKRCIEYFRGTVEEPYFFIFSDEPSWAKEHIDISHKMTIIDHNGPDGSYEDLRLMSYCQHHIIANSSFSWWGAWLRGNAGKIVIAPERWFRRDDLDTKDLIPETWIRI